MKSLGKSTDGKKDPRKTKFSKIMSLPEPKYDAKNKSTYDPLKDPIPAASSPKNNIQPLKKNLDVYIFSNLIGSLLILS